MFKDRKEAGKLLAERLFKFKNKKDTIVLSIPRGGVVTASEVSKSLNAPLDVIVIKKIGHPRNKEYAIGAASIDDFYLNEEALSEELISKDYIKTEIKLKQKEAKDVTLILRGDKPKEDIKNKIVIVVDDGAATGTTTLMALQIIKKQKPKKIIVALPVAPPVVISKFSKLADEVVCLLTPNNLMAVGEFYKNFEQVETEEAKEYLK